MHVRFFNDRLNLPCLIENVTVLIETAQFVFALLLLLLLVAHLPLSYLLLEAFAVRCSLVDLMQVSSLTLSGDFLLKGETLCLRRLQRPRVVMVLLSSQVFKVAATLVVPCISR